MDMNNDAVPIPHYPAVARFCRMITGTPWDGEDLLQETIFKVLKSVPIEKRPDLPKAYLFRIATNAWIDECRKNKIRIETYEDERHWNGNEVSNLVIGEAIEELVHHLPPKSAAIVLLVDVFRFTTRETAELLEDTNEGAVKTALRRARQRLAQLADEASGMDKQSANSESHVRKLIEAFADAFRRHDPFAIVQAYKSLARIGIQVERQQTASRLFFTFADPDGNVLMISI